MTMKVALSNSTRVTFSRVSPPHLDAIYDQWDLEGTATRIRKLSLRDTKALFAKGEVSFNSELLQCTLHRDFVLQVLRSSNSTDLEIVSGASNPIVAPDEVLQLLPDSWFARTGLLYRDTLPDDILERFAASSHPPYGLAGHKNLSLEATQRLLKCAGEEPPHTSYHTLLETVASTSAHLDILCHLAELKETELNIALLKNELAREGRVLHSLASINHDLLDEMTAEQITVLREWLTVHEPEYVRMPLSWSYKLFHGSNAETESNDDNY